MLWMISKFIMCLIAAGAFGFLFGWILSSLIKNEKLNEKYNLLQDEYGLQKAELNQSLSDVNIKNEEINMLQKELQQTQKDLLIKTMDLEECEKNGPKSSVLKELEMENNNLKEEIAEYQYLENENSILHNELKALEDEKDKLLLELEELKSLNNGFINKVDNKEIKRYIKKTKKILKKIEKSLS